MNIENSVTAQTKGSISTSLPLIETTDVTKRYGPTVAANKISFQVNVGEVLGLVGANGAGKSVMMRILSGVTCPDDGVCTFQGQGVPWDEYNPVSAKERGVRIVFQELSLCTNLKVYENFYLEHSKRLLRLFSWRKSARVLAREAIDAVFPGNQVDVRARVGSLPIAQQQMVEIARAVSDENLRLLILDEPTSSLPRDQTEQLLQYVRARRGDNVSFIFISHRLTEVLSLADRIYVMQSGTVKWTGTPQETDENDLVERMGEGSKITEEVASEEGLSFSASIEQSPERVGLQVDGLSTKNLSQIDLSMKGGEIVGIAGLDGSGQRELLQTLFRPGRNRREIRRTGSIAYVTGDRKTEGVFSLWSIAENMVIGKIARNRIFAPAKQKAFDVQVRSWYDQLGVTGTGIRAPIVSLSGGNQQKILIARSLVSRADIIILDDPTRGIDIATKRLLYKILEEAAAKGKLIVWYSTEDEEFRYCSTVVVMHDGSIVKTLDRAEATKDNIINASFSRQADRKESHLGVGRASLDLTGIVIPFLAMAAFFILCGILQPNVFSFFGINLLLTGAIPLVFATLSQTFVIGLSHVDIGIGNYIGLVNVLCATILVQTPSLGALALVGVLVFYASMGFLIHLRKLPSIVVTLGFSFIWIGIAYTVQLQPGGSAPGWLSAAYGLSLPLLPRPVYIIFIAALVATWIYFSRYGTVLRGFGNNPQAMRRSGWSELWANVTSYLVSGVFGLLGGLFVTAITQASDANAETSVTLLSVAAVVVGGGYLSGGTVSPFGSVFGALTLSLIATLIGFLNISSSYVTAVQGLILLLVLALRLLRKEKEQ